MRSPGVIYRRYRQIKKKILYDALSEGRQCLHKNCHYGKVLRYTDEFNRPLFINTCGYNSLQGSDQIEGCTNPVECSAYANKWTRDKIVEVVDAELSDHEIKKRKYPELTLLEWVLDKDLNDAIKNPGFFGRIIVRCIEFLESILRNK